MLLDKNFNFLKNKIQDEYLNWIEKICQLATNYLNSQNNDFFIESKKIIESYLKNEFDNCYDDSLNLEENINNIWKRYDFDKSLKIYLYQIIKNEEKYIKII